MPTMYILRLCISRNAFCKHLLLTLEAWAHLKECVRDFISLFLILQSDKNCLLMTLNVKSSGFYHGQQH